MNSQLSSSGTLGKVPPMETSSNYDFFFCPLRCLPVEGPPTFTGTRGAGFYTCRRASVSVSAASQPQKLPGEWGLARNLPGARLGRGSLQRDVVTLVGRTQRALPWPGELPALWAGISHTPSHLLELNLLKASKKTRDNSSYFPASGWSRNFSAWIPP